MITIMREVMSNFVLFLIFCWLTLGSAISAPTQDATSSQEEALRSVGPSGPEAEIPEELAEGKKALSRKEEVLKAKEAQLKIMEQDILEKVQELKKLKKDLAKAADLQKIEDPKREEELTRLARVYEAAPPEQAAQLLGKLDIKLAAQILMRIDTRKAGKIWGYVEPIQGAKISAEIGKGVSLYEGGRE